MSQPAIEAPIVSTYDPRGVLQAQKSLGGLQSTFKKFGLARKLTFAALSAAAYKYGKDAVKAAAADEAAQRKLANTIKNLGKSYALSSVNQFIKTQEDATGISKEVLRPELEKLLLVTKTVGEAQDLLNTALNVSAGSSYSLGQVTSALTKAQTGNFSALKKMSLGVDETVLASEDLYLIQEELNRLFAGSAKAANMGLAADLKRIRTASGNAKESIGKGLTVAIEGFIRGAGGVDAVTKSMITYADAAGLALSRTAGLTEKIGGILNAPMNLANAGLEISKAFSKVFEFRPKLTGEEMSETKRFRLRIANSKDFISQKKKEADAEKKLGKIQKENAYTKKLNQLFDNDLVSINAALQNKISDDTRTRLLALKAQKTEDVNDDKQAIMDIISAQKKRLDDAVNGWKEEALAAKTSYADQYAAYLAFLEKIKNNPIKQYVEYVSSSGQKITAPADFGVPGSPAKKSQAPVILLNPTDTAPPTTPISSQPPAYQPPPVISDTLGFAGGSTVAGIPVAGVGQTVNVDVAVNGFVGNEQALAEEIARKLQLAQKLGYSTSIVGVP